MKNDNDETLSERVDERIEPSLKEAVRSFAADFGMKEGWGWRLLATKALGDAAPEIMRKRFRKFLTGFDW